MKHVVFKYKVMAGDRLNEPVAVEMPRGAVILSAGVEGNWFIVWAFVDPSFNETVFRHIYIATTGEPIPDFKGRMPVFINRIDAVPLKENPALVLRFHAFDFGETPR